jgi:prepilin-type N-terminal cleavage/methylation domain-containing protein/prepilin-type processing-associated H-X9-DG protein
MRFRAHRRHGFTLIELLVVIAIIAILASILFPVFSSARAKGRQAACISNVKQLVLAMHMYAQDYDEMFPFSTAAAPAGGEGYYAQLAGIQEWQWYDGLYDYTRNRDINLCPEIKTVIPGYGMNAAMSGMSLGYMWDSAKKVLIIDFADPNSLGTPHGQSQVTGIADPLLDNRYAHRHNGGYVVGYGDGHAKHQKPDALNASVYWDPAEEG